MDRGRGAEDALFVLAKQDHGGGTSANLEAMLVQQGKTETEARGRTTCEVFSNDDVAVRGYTLFGGQPTLIPVAVY